MKQEKNYGHGFKDGLITGLLILVAIVILIQVLLYFNN